MALRPMFRIQTMKTALSIFAAMTFVAGSAFAAEPAAAPKADAAKGAQIASQVCAACHNADGNSVSPVNPKLAGQHPEYIAKQIADLKANKTRKSAVMMGFASGLSADDARNVAAYFSAQKPKDGAARSAQGAKLGEKIYRGGIPEKGVAACAGCHGPTGAGIPAQYPRIAGQWADYTKLQLVAFRSGERANDPAGMMRGVATRMSDAEMAAVSDYIAGLKNAN